MSKKAIVYCRIASLVEGDFRALKMQAVSGLKFALSQGFEDVHVLCEQTLGTEITERETLNKILGLSKSGEIEAVFVTSLGRLSRDLRHRQAIRELLRENGVEIKAVNTTPELEFEEKLGDIFSQYEKEKRINLIKRSLAHKVKQAKS